jgi:hypothetical protein
MEIYLAQMKYKWYMPSNVFMDERHVCGMVMRAAD